MIELRTIVMGILREQKMFYRTIDADFLFITIDCYLIPDIYAFCGKDENGEWELSHICDEKRMLEIKMELENEDYTVSIV